MNLARWGLRLEAAAVYSHARNATPRHWRRVTRHIRDHLSECRQLCFLTGILYRVVRVQPEGRPRSASLPL
jgi:hypothetical protein